MTSDTRDEPRGAAPLLFGSPSAGFDAPFEMLSACHERVERTLRLLERLGVHLRTHGADDQARSAARDVLRYFEVAAPQHHEDEERHVLPALRSLGHGAVADRVAADHAAMDAVWAGMRTDLRAVAEGDAGAATGDEAQARWREFAALYRRHIELEDHAAFPSAEAALDGAARRAMGAEMARRRGVGP